MKLYIFLTITLPFWAMSAMAQVASPIASVVPSPSALPVLPPVSPQASSSGQWLVDLALKYPKLSALIFIIGALRIVLKPLFSFLHQVLPQLGLVAWDQEVSAIELSKPVRAIYWVLDYFGSIKVPVSQAKQ